jgi:GAF domain
MKKRSKAANQSAKAPHRKAGRSIPRAMPSCGSAPARETEVARLTRERDEAQEQQTATSEVLQVISSSSGELEPVFSTLLESAVRICEAKFGMLYLHEGGGFRPVAARDVPPMFAEALWGRRDFLPAPGGVLESVMKTRRTVHVSDLAATQAYLERHPSLTAGVELGGIRTVVGIPMLTGDELVGVIGIYRQEVRSFTEKQIALLTSFAAQAVIAIENARLLNELRQRTDDLSRRTIDLTEALEQQTATSEVLQVIGSSPGDLEPVFSSMLENAVRICDATFGNIYRWDGEALLHVAGHNTPPAYAEARRRLPPRPSPRNPFGRMIKTKEAVHVADLAAEQDYVERSNPDGRRRRTWRRAYDVIPILRKADSLGIPKSPAT